MSERLDRIEKIMEELAIGQKKLEEAQLKTDAQITRLEEGFARVEQAQLKTDAQITRLEEGFARVEQAQLKTDAQITRLEENQEKLQSTLNKLGFNIGKATEHIFIDAISKTLKFGNVQYDSIGENIYFKQYDVEGECDIVLYNGNSIALIEVKHNVKEEDIDKLKKELCPKFKKAFPIYSSFKYYLGIATAHLSSSVKEYAKQNGIGIFLPNADAKELANINLKAY